VSRACLDLSRKLDTDHPTHIIGLARGGLVPATIIANMLGIRKVYSIGIASYQMSEGGIEFGGDINVYQQLPVNCSDISNGDNVLIVDDISDKGNTFNRAESMIQDTFNCKVRTLALYTKPCTAHVPTYFYKQVPQDCWVVFPWEKQVAQS